MASKDLQGFPIRREIDASLRRGALDLQAMVDRAIAAGEVVPHTIDPVDAADAMAMADAAKRAAARARARRGVMSPGSLQARSCTIREKREVSLNRTAPSGAPAGACQPPVNAGTAAALQGETGHRLNGHDDASPLRKVEGKAPPRLSSANPRGQSCRPDPIHTEAAS